MGVAQRIVELCSKGAEDYTLQRVQVGLIYSAVQLDNGVTGVAYTFPKGQHCGSDWRSGHKPLAGRKASEIIPSLGSKNLVSSSLALAAVNALLSTSNPPERAVFGDILENLDIRGGDRVCMVGCFLPLISGLEKRKAEVVSVDEVSKPGSRPREEVDSLLPGSQIAIITATAIVNNTIDHILDLSQSCREVAVLGPSTPLLAEAFWATPVSCLSGIRIEEPEKVFQIIGEGGGFREFKGYVQKVNVRLR